MLSLSVIILSGCTRTTDITQSILENNPIQTDESIETNKQGENVMEEKLLTKEELIQAI